MGVCNVDNLSLSSVTWTNINWFTLGRNPLSALLVRSLSPSQVAWRNTFKRTRRGHLDACSVTKFSLKLVTSNFILWVTPGWNHLDVCSVTKFSQQMATLIVIFGLTPARRTMFAPIVRSPSHTPVVLIDIDVSTVEKPEQAPTDPFNLSLKICGSTFTFYFCRFCHYMLTQNV